MLFPRVSTSSLTDGYCPAIVAESLASVSAVDAVACCAVVCRAGNPAAMKSEMPIAAIKGRALPIAPTPSFSPYRLLIAELNQPGEVYYCSGWKSHRDEKCPPQHARQEALGLWRRACGPLDSNQENADLAFRPNAVPHSGAPRPGHE